VGTLRPASPPTDLVLHVVVQTFEVRNIRSFEISTWVLKKIVKLTNSVTVGSDVIMRQVLIWLPLCFG